MSEKQDYYEILNVAKDADATEIKARYRKLAIKYHPDKNPDNQEAEEKFKEATEAYKILSDEKTRNLYDQYGHAGLEGYSGSSSGGYQDIFSTFESVFGDFFGFGGGRSKSQRKNRPQRGSDLRYNLSIEFEEAAFGVRKQIRIEKLDICDECGGTGAKEGTGTETCSYCNGSGEYEQRQGFFSIRTTCPYCKGEGERISNPCPKCRGNKRIRTTKKVSIKIPAGVDNGSKLRLSNEGEAGVNGGGYGDLYVVLNIKEHKYFQRYENDIACLVEISFIQAILGDEIEVKTLRGQTNLIIPKGTQYDDEFVLKGEGIKSLNSDYVGNLIVKVQVKIPKKISKKQEELLEQFKKAEKKGFTASLKNLFKQ